MESNGQRTAPVRVHSFIVAGGNWNSERDRSFQSLSSASDSAPFFSLDHVTGFTVICHAKCSYGSDSRQWGCVSVAVSLTCTDIGVAAGLTINGAPVLVFLCVSTILVLLWVSQQTLAMYHCCSASHNRPVPWIIVAMGPTTDCVPVLVLWVYEDRIWSFGSGDFYTSSKYSDCYIFYFCDLHVFSFRLFTQSLGVYFVTRVDTLLCLGCNIFPLVTIPSA
jgi:hypothetical protein